MNNDDVEMSDEGSSMFFGGGLREGFPYMLSENSSIAIDGVLYSMSNYIMVQRGTA